MKRSPPIAAAAALCLVCILPAAAEAARHPPECRVHRVIIRAWGAAFVTCVDKPAKLSKRKSEMPTDVSARKRVHRKIRGHRARGSVGLAGIVGPLADKIRSIAASCPGTSVVSAMRHSYVAGTRRISLHASGRAVDVSGRYGCIYGQLANWPGGYSIDAGRMRHIHISYDPRGREWGARFAHGGGGHRRHGSRFARRHWDGPIRAVHDRMAG